MSEPIANLNPYSPPRAELDPLWPLDRGDASLDASLIDARRGTRLGAAIVDFLLLLGAFLPGALTAIFGGDARSAAAVLLMLAVVPLVIYQWYLIATTGQTLGKKWLRIRVVKMDGTPVNFVSGVIVRNWVPWLIVQGFAFFMRAVQSEVNPASWLSLVDVLWIFGGASRCVHDYLAGTRVVQA